MQKQSLITQLLYEDPVQFVIKILYITGNLKSKEKDTERFWVNLSLISTIFSIIISLIKFYLGSDKFKVGMKVKWIHHPKGKGHGIIAKISEGIAVVEKVIDKDGNPAKPLKLPLHILKPF